jgi:hypothetical protein
VKSPALARGSPWALDEEVVAGAARLPVHQSARLAAVCPVAADALEEAALHRDVSQAVVPERGPEHAQDAMAAVAQGAVRREPRVLQTRRGVPPQAPLAPPSLPERAQVVSLREQQAQEL